MSTSYVSLDGEMVGTILVNRELFSSTPDEFAKGQFMYTATHEQFHLDNLIAAHLGAHAAYSATQDHIDMATESYIIRVINNFNRLNTPMLRVGFARAATQDYIANAQLGNMSERIESERQAHIWAAKAKVNEFFT